MDLTQPIHGGHRQILSKLVCRLQGIWETYCQQGPGNVDSSLFDGIDDLARRFEEEFAQFAKSNPERDFSDDPRQTVHELCRLARRCACTPQGLCFVTGEAGLIRKKDQELAYIQGLERIRRVLVAD